MKRRKKSKIKFFTLYNTFSDTEKNQFRHFATSPLFNGGRDYSFLLNEIETGNLSSNDSAYVSKERTIWNRLSELTKLAEKFLVVRSAESSDFEYEFLLLSELKKRGLRNYFRSEVKSFDIRINHTFPFSKRNFFLEINKIITESMISDSHPDFKKIASQIPKTNDYQIGIFLLDFLDNLIRLWLMKKDKMVTSTLFAESLFYSLNFKTLLEFIREKVPSLYPSISFYLCIINSLKDPTDNSSLEKAKYILSKQLKLINDDYTEKFYEYMIECCLAVLNVKQTSANARQLFEVMNRKLKAGFHNDIRNIHYRKDVFRNYVLTGIYLKKTKWVEKFIKEYGPLLPDENREDIVALSNASILFEKKEFTACKEAIAKVKKTNSYHYTDGAILGLMCCYELEEFDNVFEELRRLRDYFRREHRIDDGFVKYRLGFCNLYSLLLRYKANPGKKNLTDLTMELNKENVPGIGWIKLKLSKLGVNTNQSI